MPDLTDSTAVRSSYDANIAELSAMARRIGQPSIIKTRNQDPEFRRVERISYVLLALLILFATVVYIEEHIAIRHDIDSVPSYSYLPTATGTLEQQAYIRHGYGRSKYTESFGILRTGKTEFLGFSCNPQTDDMDCVYTGQWASSPFIGKTVTVRYAQLPRSTYGPFDVGPSAVEPNLNVHVDRQPRTVAMEITTNDDSGGHDILSYQSSLSRLQRDRSWFSVTQADRIGAVFMICGAFGLLIPTVRRYTLPVKTD